MPIAGVWVAVQLEAYERRQVSVVKVSSSSDACASPRQAGSPWLPLFFSLLVFVGLRGA